MKRSFARLVNEARDVLARAYIERKETDRERNCVHRCDCVCQREELQKAHGERDALRELLEVERSGRRTMADAVARLIIERQELKQAVAFAASAIKSGEGWSSECERLLGK